MSPRNLEVLNNLKELQDEVLQYIKGQNEAAKALTTVVFKYFLRKIGKENWGFHFPNAPTCLLLGPTGCGKTFLVKTLSYICDLPMIEINAKSICQEGWKGHSLEDLISNGFYQFEKQTNTLLSTGIIFIDEFDKLAKDNFSSGGDDVNYHLQASILKYIEGAEVVISGRQRKLSKFLFVFGGAFEGLDINPENNIGFTKHKDIEKILDKALINYGLLPEIVGRITEKIFVKRLTKEDYFSILNSESDENLFKQWQDLLKMLEINLPEVQELLVEKAIKSDLGARGLIQAIEELVTKVLNDNIDDADLEKFSPIYFPRKSL